MGRHNARTARPRLVGLGLLVLAVLTLLALASWLASIAWSAAQVLPDASFDRLLEGTLAGFGAPVAVWLALSVTSSAWQIARGLPRPSFSPAVVHRLVGAVLGVALVAVPTAAQAAPTPSSVSATSVAAAPESSQSLDPNWAAQDAPEAASASIPALEPGWTPTAADVPRPAADPAPSEVVGATRPERPGAEPAAVVVLRGESLWDIAARHLGPDATAVDIAEAWPQWWHANRDVIGSDPDLILPGQQLRVPQL